MEPQSPLLTDLAGLHDRLGSLLSAVREGEHAERLLCAVATATQLLIERHFLAAIDLALDVLGTATEADRLAIWRMDGTPDPASRTYVLRHEWNAPGLDPERLRAFERLSLDDALGQPWRDDLLGGLSVRFAVEDLAPPLAAAVAKTGLRSGLVTPIRAGGAAWGLVVMSTQREGRIFTLGEESVMRTMAGAIGAAIERERAEAERAALERRARDTEKLESLALLAGGIAHDQNNVLCLMRLLPSPEPRLADAIEALARLTRQLRLYAGNESPAVAPVHLHERAREMARLLAASFPDTVELDIRELAPVPPILADPTLVDQAIVNLLVNARQAIDEESQGRVAISTAAASDSRHVEIAVADTGRGMNETTRARMFDPFFTTKPTGQGLGLATVATLLRSAGGEARVESAPRKGTTIRLVFPVAAPAGAGKEPAARTEGSAK